MASAEASLRGFQSLLFTRPYDADVIKSIGDYIPKLFINYQADEINYQLFRAIIYRSYSLQEIIPFLSRKDVKIQDLQYQDPETLLQLQKNGITLDSHLSSVLDFFVKSVLPRMDKFVRDIYDAIISDDLDALNSLPPFDPDLSIRMDNDLFQYDSVPLLCLALQHNSKKCFKKLLLMGANPAKRSLPRFTVVGYHWDSLDFAVALGDRAIIRLLMEQDLKPKLETVQAAALFHQNGILRWLLGPTTVSSENDQLYEENGWLDEENGQFYEGNGEFSLKLDSAVSPLTRQEWTNRALDICAEHDNLEGLEFSFKKGGQPNILNFARQNCMIRACQRGSIEAIKILIEHGVSVNSKDDGDRNALMMAAAMGQYNTVLFLLEHGANMNAFDADSQSAMMKAAGGGYHEIVELFIKRGASVSTSDKDGETPLTYACRKGSLESVKLLVEAGAKLRAKTSEGITAYDLAQAGGYEDICTYLSSKGVGPTPPPTSKSSKQSNKRK